MSVAGSARDRRTDWHPRSEFGAGWLLPIAQRTNSADVSRSGMVSRLARAAIDFRGCLAGVHAHNRDSSHALALSRELACTTGVGARPTQQVSAHPRCLRHRRDLAGNSEQIFGRPETTFRSGNCLSRSGTRGQLHSERQTGGGAVSRGYRRVVLSNGPYPEIWLPRTAANLG